MRVCSELPMLASRSSTTRAAVLLELEVFDDRLLFEEAKEEAREEDEGPRMLKRLPRLMIYSFVGTT